MMSFSQLRDRALQAPLAKTALLVGFLSSGMLLGGAHIFEALGYPPCELCLDQREAHWAALGVALAGLLVAFVFKAPLSAAASVGALALVYALSAGLSFYHTGVEYGFWPGPASCSTVGAAVTDISLLQSAFSEEAKGPACNEAAWRFLGISMAGYNFLASSGLFALALAAAISATRQARRGRNATHSPIVSTNA